MCYCFAMKNCGIFCIFFLVCAHTSVSGSTTSSACTQALMLEQRKLDEQLFSAINKRKPKLDQIQHLIDQGANVNAQFGWSRKTLAHAVKSVPVLVLLVEGGLHLGTVDRWGANRLHYAEKKNTSFELLQTFIDLSDESSALLDQRRYGDGSTPLMALVTHGQSRRILKKIKLLIDSGSNVNATVEKNGITALHKAAKYGYLKSAKLLIENEANVNAVARINVRGLLNDNIKNMLPIDFYERHTGLEGFMKNSEARKLLKPTMPRVLNSNAEYRPYRDKVR